MDLTLARRIQGGDTKIWILQGDTIIWIQGGEYGEKKGRIQEYGYKKEGYIRQMKRLKCPKNEDNLNKKKL